MRVYSLGTTLLVGGLLTAAAPTLRAQVTAPVFPGDSAATVDLANIVETTRSKGLPVDPILAEAHHAMLVHAAPGRIVAIARQIAERLEVSRDALAPRPIPNDIAAGAAALSYHVPREALTLIRRATPADSSVAVPLGALAQLVASGVPVRRASDIVTSLIKRGVTAKQLASFSNDVDSDVRLGGHPEDAINIRLRGLTAALAPPGGNAALTAATAAPGGGTGPKKPPTP